MRWSVAFLWAVALTACVREAPQCALDTDCDTQAERCVDGACEPTPLTCDDGDPCHDDRGCPRGFCDISPEHGSEGCCVDVSDCSIDADCAADCFCDPRRGLCQCFSLHCDPQTSAECPDDRVCVWTDGEGACVQELPAAASCAVIAHDRVIDDERPALAVSGAPLRLRALARDAVGRLVPHASFSYSGPDVSAAGVLWSTCTNVEGCLVRAIATTDGAACEGAVRVWPAAPPDTARAFVVDADSGAPLAGVTVAFGAGAEQVTATTDELGRAQVARSDDILAAVSAFPPAHAWLTVLDAPRDVVLPVRAIVPRTRVAGLKGDVDFTRVSTQGDVKLALTGVSVHGDPTALTARALIGERVPTRVDVEGVTAEGGDVIGLPLAVVLEIGNDRVRSPSIVLGDAGRRVAWALGGKIRWSELGPLVSQLGDETGALDGEGLLRGLAPFFNRFDHAVDTDLPPLELVDRPADDPPGTPAPADAWPLTTHAFVLDTLATSDVKYALPPLPCAHGLGASPACEPPPDAPAASPFFSGALLLTAAHVPAEGLVPLGLGAAFDRADPDGDAADGIVDPDVEQTGAPARGETVVDYAPPHDGLEGQPLVTIAIAFLEGFDPLTPDPWAHSVRALVDRSTSPAAGVRAFPVDDFLAAPGGAFSATSGTFVPAPQADGALVRLVLDDGAGASWQIWLGAAADLSLADLVPPEVTLSDRVMRARVESFLLDESAQISSPGALAAAGDRELSDLMELSIAWAVEPCRPPRSGPAQERVASACDDVDAAP